LRSYVKIYGPPVFEAIKALERIAVDTPEVCIMNTIISRSIPDHIAQDIGAAPVRSPTGPQDPRIAGWASNYFSSSGVSVPVERCVNIISRSGESLGEYDFFFEWFRSPSREQLEDLVEKVDKALAPLGCFYTITTRK
jgi:hypothetical protein